MVRRLEGRHSDGSGFGHLGLHVFDGEPSYFGCLDGRVSASFADVASKGQRQDTKVHVLVDVCEYLRFDRDAGLFPDLTSDSRTRASPAPPRAGDRSGQLRRSNFSAPWVKALAEAGLPADTHVHDLRHTGNTFAAETGHRSPN
jgi:hypothetical protein